MRREIAALLATTAVVGACGGGERPFRIGVVIDCVGIGRPLKAAEQAGAELPLVERGAAPGGGVTVAGRRVELVPACTETLEFSVLVRELRRLAEEEHVDAVVAGTTGADEVALRDVARSHPGVIFVAAAHGAREVTLHRTASNLYRFAGDHAQGVAGLATYAYGTLGWRTVTIVYHNWDLGWDSRDAFAAEFCALGGTLTSQLAVDAFAPRGRDVERLPAGADGVAVFAVGFAGPAGFLRRLARTGRGEAPRRMVVGPGVLDDPAVLAATDGRLAGVVGTSQNDPARLRDLVRRVGSHFPGVPAAVAASESVTGYRDGVEALLTGLERAHGDAARLPAALARGRIGLLGGDAALDEHRQAVTSTTLVRVQAPGAGPVPLQRIGVRDGVDQSLGGLLPDSLRPADRPAPCARRASATRAGPPR